MAAPDTDAAPSARGGSPLPPGFGLFRETGVDDPAFRFALPLGMDWTCVGEPGRAPTQPGTASPLAIYSSGGEPRVEVTVSGWLLKRDVAPARFLEIVVEGAAEEILEKRESDAPGGNVLDVLSRQQVEGGRLAIRRTAIKDGARLLVLRVMAREADYAGVVGNVSAIVEGFRFLEPKGWHCAESLSTFSLGQPSDFLLFYPESWRMDGSLVARPQVLTARFRNDLGADAVGVIDLAVVSREAEPQLERFAGEVFHRLERGGLRCATLPLAPAAPFGPFDAAWEATTEATVDGRPLELRLVVGRRPDAWFGFALQGPVRKAAADVWAVNRRALEIVSGLMATPDHPKARWIADAIEAAK